MNTKPFIAALLILHLCMLGCEPRELKPKENAMGEIVSLPAKWSFPLHENGQVSNSILEVNLVHDNHIILATTNGPGNKQLTAVNLQTGESTWRWNDVFQPEGGGINIRNFYLADNIMVYNHGTRRYGINLTTGQTQWKLREDEPFDSRISGVGSSFLALGPQRDTLEDLSSQAIFQGDIYTGAIKQFLLTDIDYDTEGEFRGGGRLVTVIGGLKAIDIVGKPYIIVISSDPFPNWFYSIMVGLYDYENRSWVYNRKLVAPPSQYNAGTFIHTEDDRMYISAGNRIACHSLATGDQIWEQLFPRDFMFSGFIVEEGVVVANCEDSKLYGLDALTGKQLWKGKGAGTSSRLEGRYLNGIVYFSGGSTSRIHAVDIHTGRTVWMLDPALIDETVDDWKPDIYVVPPKNGGKGHVVACTHLHAYCFEAYR